MLPSRETDVANLTVFPNSPSIVAMDSRSWKKAQRNLIQWNLTHIEAFMILSDNHVFTGLASKICYSKGSTQMVKVSV